MIDAKTAKKNSDALDNSTNKTTLTIIEKMIVEASIKGKYSVSIGEKNINETIMAHLKELGYKVVRPQGSISPYYVISWS